VRVDDVEGLACGVVTSFSVVVAEVVAEAVAVG
jgi:hypothetical protein